MQDKRYDSLENFFRKGAQKYEFEFEEKDWRKMEAKLDAPGRHRPNKWLDFLKKFFILLGIISVTWFGYYYLNSTSAELPKVKETATAQPKANDASIENEGTEAANQSSQNDNGPLDTDNAASQRKGADNNPKSNLDDNRSIGFDSNDATRQVPDGETKEVGQQPSTQLHAPSATIETAANQHNNDLFDNSDSAASQQIGTDNNPKSSLDNNQQIGIDNDDASQKVSEGEAKEVGQQPSIPFDPPAPTPETVGNQKIDMDARSDLSEVTNANGNPIIEDPSTSANPEIRKGIKTDLKGNPLETGNVISSSRKNDNNAKVPAESKPVVTGAKKANAQDEVTDNEREHIKDVEINGKRSENRVVEASTKSPGIKLSNSANQTSLPKSKELLASDEESAGGAGRDNRIYHRITSVNSLAPDLGPTTFNPELGSVRSAKVETTTIEDEEIFSSLSSWAIGVVAAPDFSSVGLVDNLQPGKKLGVSIEYPISRKLSLSTAIVRSTNNYKVQGEVYRAPAGFWRQVTNGIVPESVSAKCEILDIPINLRYTITDKPKSRLFISSGFSTYFMLNEQYDFTYRPINPGPVESWEVSNENQHFFGIVNFSAGYEFLMANNLSFQVEPFLKVPITDIGFGRVDLFSTGALFSLKYHFRRSKLRPLRIKE